MSDNYNSFGVNNTPIGLPTKTYSAFGVINSNQNGLSTIYNTVTESNSPQALSFGFITSDIQSANFVHLSSGWKISANGDAEFQSLVGVNLTGTNITGATITGSTITGGIIRTNNTGTRLELNSVDNAFYLYKSGDIRVAITDEGITFLGPGEIGSGAIYGLGTNSLALDVGGGNGVEVNDSEVLPFTDNAMSLGDVSSRWTEVWAVDGSINTSDIRIKKNVVPLNYGLKEVMQLEPIRYSMYKKDNKLGLSAQAVYKVIPEATINCEETSEEGSAGIRPTDLIPVLINAIKELKGQIDDLTRQINKSVV